MFARLMLRSKDPTKRSTGIWELGHSGDPRAIEPLITALRDPDSLVRIHAAEALAELGRHAVEPLIAALHHDDQYVRDIAVKALGKIGDPRAVGPLIEALGDGTFVGRFWVNDVTGHISDDAREALAQLGDAAMGPLVAALGNHNKLIRTQAARALAGIGDGVVEQLTERLDVDDLAAILLDVDLPRTFLPMVKQALLGVRPAEATPAAEAITAYERREEHLDRMASDRALADTIQTAHASGMESERNRIMAVASLGHAEPHHLPDACDALVTVVLEDDGPVQHAAEDAVLRIGTPAVRLLIQRLTTAPWRRQIPDPSKHEPYVLAGVRGAHQVLTQALSADGCQLTDEDLQAIADLTEMRGTVYHAYREPDDTVEISEATVPVDFTDVSQAARSELARRHREPV